MTPREDQIQAACVGWLDIQANLGRLRFTAIPLGERRDKVTGARLKRQGARKGAPDLVIALHDGKTLWAEIKTATGRLSKEQADWWDTLRALGHGYVVVRDLQHLIDAVGACRSGGIAA